MLAYSSAATKQQRLLKEGQQSVRDLQEELPPWARKDQLKKLAESEGKDLPFGLYLFLATIMGIVAVSTTCCLPVELTRECCICSPAVHSSPGPLLPAVNLQELMQL